MSSREKNEALATSRVHPIRVRSWIKVILQSGTGMRVAKTFVIIHPARGQAIDVHLDERGEAEVEVPYGRVQVEFPSLFRVSRIDSVPTKDVQPAERHALVNEGHPVIVARGANAPAGAPTEAVDEPWERHDLSGDDEVDIDDRPHIDADIAHDHGEVQDEFDGFRGATEGTEKLEVDTPAFWVPTQQTHVFEVKGALDLRLSHEFFEASDAAEYEIRDEDGEVLLRASTQARELSFPALGVGIHRFKIGDCEYQLVATQVSHYIQFIAPEDALGAP